MCVAEDIDPVLPDTTKKEDGAVSPLPDVTITDGICKFLLSDVIALCYGHCLSVRHDITMFTSRRYNYIALLHVTRKLVDGLAFQSLAIILNGNYSKHQYNYSLAFETPSRFKLLRRVYTAD